MNKGKRINAAIIVWAFIFSILITQGIFAQTETSSVSGVVTDPQGKVLTGATVTLTNPAKNFTRTQTTNEDGTYTFAAIPPDTYTLEVSATGFKKTILNSVQALVAKPTETNVQLEIGNINEAITVSAAGNDALINNQDATLGNNFVSRQIIELPLEARDVTSLLTLQPGVTREGFATGARNDQGNVTLDGVDINESQTNQIAPPRGGAGSDIMKSATEEPDSSTVLRLNSEAIDAFRVTTSNPNASLGRSSGAQISLISKSGSNTVRGSLFEYHRNTIFTANDFFNNRLGRYTATDTNVLVGLNSVGDEIAARPKLIRNTFGGALGGPIVKDKLFFFYSFEARRDASETTVVQRVPLASLGRGEVRYINPSGGITTVTAANLATIFPVLGGVNPIAVAAFRDAAAKYPANDFTVGDSTPSRLLNTAGYRFNSATPVTLNSHVGRFDFNLTPNQQLFARISIQHDVIGGTRTFPDTPSQDTWSHPWGLAAGHTWIISNNLVNNFRYGMTRESFTSLGDAAKNEIYFRNVFFPVLDSRTISRVTPVQNFTDDFSWVKGNHTFQFGTNIRLIRNRRVTYANAFDTAYTNPSGYFGSGNPISNAINAFSPIGTGAADVRNAATALFGRLTAIEARFTFDRDGNLLPAGTPSEREFATEEYDFYFQDFWKARPNLTFTYGLRYGISRPVYETSGYEAKPNITLSEFLRRRAEGAARGVPYNDPITIELSGPKNGKSPLYHWDKNNFQPRLGVAWSPNFKSGFLRKLFGKQDESVIRGGFGITNDYYGQQLAVSFDLNNQLGFASSVEVSAGTCGITAADPICPLFSSFSQDVRSLLAFFGSSLPSKLTFPQTRPLDNDRRIETSLDEELVAPISYSWNLTYERSLPKGLFIQTSYVGRAARNLLARRDVATLNNLVDPKSGMDWYTAAGQLEDIRRNFALKGITSDSSDPVLQQAIGSVAPIPYFENLFGNLGPGFIDFMVGTDYASNATQAILGDAIIFNGNDWTQTQNEIDRYLVRQGLSPKYYHPQYGALMAFGSLGNSNYHGGTLSIRQRLGDKLTWDFNYTLSHSLDDASASQTGGSGTTLILNPLRQHDNYASSDFDVRHIININAVWQIPVGRGRWLLRNSNKWVEGFLGGWQLSGIYRWNSGLPYYAPYDDSRWATNWSVESGGVRIRPLETCPTRGIGEEGPSLFGCNRTEAYQSWRNARPGESGDRNVFRLPGYVVLDMGLAKSIKMPWGEDHRLQIRAEAFNVTNTQTFGGISNITLELDPQNKIPPSDWWNFTSIQGTPRVMQFGLRYSF